MPEDPLGERWALTYREAPQVFDAFSRAEDRGGLLVPALIEASTLRERRVLELGCGTGRWTRELAPAAASLVALEPAPGMLALARRAGGRATHWVRARAEALPFASGAFERVVAAFVFANLRPRVRAAALREARRALAAGGQLWLVENHWEDDFQALRREAGLRVEVEVAPLLEDGFEVIETLETEMRFESDDEARRILGQILGCRVETTLAAHPRSRFVHRVCLLQQRFD
jgi:SAM-dependent methyltransferase